MITASVMKELNVSLKFTHEWLKSHKVFKNNETGWFENWNFKVGPSPSKKNCYLLDWKPFENDEKCFLIHLKSSFRSQDTSVFITTFWSCRKNGLIRKTRLASKLMTSQPGLQTIAMHILPNVWQSKGNQTMKFGQLTEYNK